MWGKEWVETRDVTNRQIVSDEPLTRVMHAVRRLVTGKAVTAESVTVRHRASASAGPRPTWRNACRPDTRCCRAHGPR